MGRAGVGHAKVTRLVAAHYRKEAHDGTTATVEVLLGSTVRGSDPVAAVRVAGVEMLALNSHEHQGQAVDAHPGAHPNSADRVFRFRYDTNSPDHLLGIEITHGFPRPFTPAHTIDRAEGEWDLRVEPLAKPDFKPDEHAAIASEFAMRGLPGSVTQILGILQLSTGNRFPDRGVQGRRSRILRWSELGEKKGEGDREGKAAHSRPARRFVKTSTRQNGSTKKLQTLSSSR